MCGKQGRQAVKKIMYRNGGLTTTIAGIPYLPFAAASSMAVALLPGSFAMLDFLPL